MPIVQLALAATGAGGLLGGSLLGAGASQIASNALGNAILGGVTTGIAGGDPLKGALLGGAGGALSGYLQGGPIDASNMTATQFNDALESQLISSMQGAGLTNAQITQFLENASAADSIEIKPVKLLLEHDRTRPIGKMVSHNVTANGIEATFKIYYNF